MKHSSAASSAAKVGAIGFMALALGCAALAAYLVGSMMSSNYTGTRVVPLVVAKTDLKAGARIAAEDFQVREWPEDAVPAGAFHAIDELMLAHEGATPTVGILAGEPIVAPRLSSVSSGTGIASLIRPNMRAIALKVDDSVGFTGLVYPGAFVDIIATVRDPMGRGPSSRIAVQNARVLSLGMDADVATRQVRRSKADRLTGAPNEGGTFVTLEVTPEEAEVLSIARNEGQIDLVLRNASDDQLVETDGATPTKFSAFAPTDDPAAAVAVAGDKPAARPKDTVRVTRSRRQIQIVAHDEADRPGTAARPTTSRIETYNAN
ncbi:MAG TPA: Flp pilus assembly protein CpaB [Kofleriaceae bacterium]|nr:Flp pilus assembly protein CpaB [Kofleriaceae bacterium]